MTRKRPRVSGSPQHAAGHKTNGSPQRQQRPAGQLHNGPPPQPKNRR